MAAKPAPRERDRYARASLREQAADQLAELRAHPGVVALLVVIAGGWLFFTLTKPVYVQVADLAVGDCLYIHAPDADTDSPTGRPAGTASGAVAALFGQGSERAACDGSHSHEVLSVFAEAGGAGAPYPGRPTLLRSREAACTAAFTAWVGRPPEDSVLEPVLAVPDETAWGKGIRAGACLLASADGQFLPGSAKGSGR
jgi:hypothetical protein